MLLYMMKSLHAVQFVVGCFKKKIGDIFVAVNIAYVYG